MGANMPTGLAASVLAGTVLRLQRVHPRKRSEKIEYMHQNPVRRGLVKEPADWLWSSYGHYQAGERATVEIESEWTAAKKVVEGA